MAKIMNFIPLDRKKLEIKQKLSKDPIKNNKDAFNFGVQKGVDESFEFFANTIFLFKKYKNNVKLLMEDKRMYGLNGLNIMRVIEILKIPIIWKNIMNGFLTMHFQI